MEKKHYTVNVSFCQYTTVEEAERVKREITEMLMEKKLLSIERQEQEKLKLNA